MHHRHHLSSEPSTNYAENSNKRQHGNVAECDAKVIVSNRSAYRINQQQIAIYMYIERDIKFIFFITHRTVAMLWIVTQNCVDYKTPKTSSSLCHTQVDGCQRMNSAEKPCERKCVKNTVPNYLTVYRNTYYLLY